MPSLKNKNVDLYKKLLRIMFIMAAEVGQPLYDLLKTILEKNPKVLDDDDLGCALGDYATPQQQQLLQQILNSKMASVKKICALNKAAWKSEGFILNAPPLFLIPYFQSAIDYLKNRTRNKASKILKCLEFILAMFRLRGKNDDNLKKMLSLNNGKLQELYEILEDMIDEGYKLPTSRVELKIKKSSEYSEIPDLYYALLSYITGGEDEIRITGVRDDLDED